MKAHIAEDEHAYAGWTKGKQEEYKYLSKHEAELAREMGIWRVLLIKEIF